MNKPKVTAIITTHNRNDVVGRAIESVLNQTYTNLDCIVVDDASNTSAEEVCKKYPVKFIYIPKEKSLGGNHARNVGINSTDAEYVAFLDDDDFWLPNKIEKQVKLIEDKHCGLVYSGARAEFVSGNYVTEGTQELVGGHCISVDPYYLIQKAQVYGILPRIMSAARRLNDGMGDYVANQVIKLMNGDMDCLKKQFDAVILSVAHKEFSALNMSDFLAVANGVVYDVKGVLNKLTIDGRL